MADEWISASTAARQVMRALPVDVPDGYRWTVARLCLCLGVEQYWGTPIVKATWMLHAGRKRERWSFNDRPKRYIAWPAVSTGKTLNLSRDGALDTVYLKVDRADLSRFLSRLEEVVRPVWWETEDGRAYLKSLPETAKRSSHIL